MWFLNLLFSIIQACKFHPSTNVITGDDTQNTLLGTHLRDEIYGLGANDELVGKKGADILDGGDGNDLLNGGRGGDKLIGGAGIDTITYVDSCAGVTINLATGLAKGGDADCDKFSGVENVTGSHYKDSLTGDGGTNVLSGLNGDDTLSGLAGDDTLIGGKGKDTLYGGDGDDRLIGDTGKDVDLKEGSADTMYGGLGNDIYSVYQAGDLVIETANEGNDQVLASVDYTLTANVENLTLFGAVDGTGNELANKITGSSAGNVINGKGGLDDLVGGAGADIFVFETPDAASRDIIRDFATGEDQIAISASGFGLSLAPGSALPADYLFFDPAKPASADPSQTSHGQFILVQDSATIASLFWDGDGALDGLAPVAVAVFNGGSAPTASDFVIV